MWYNGGALRDTKYPYRTFEIQQRDNGVVFCEKNTFDRLEGVGHVKNGHSGLTRITLRPRPLTFLTRYTVALQRPVVNTCFDNH
jgi:hypothetical protein